MDSLKLLNQLKEIPKSDRNLLDENNEYLFNGLQILKDRDVLIDAVILSSGLGYIFLDSRNVTDELFEAYKMQYPRLSDEKSLYEKFIEARNEGEQSIEGLVSGLKGKMFEFQVQENLQNKYPEMEFEISPIANQPIWDIRGIDSNGEEMFIQVKMMASNGAYKLSQTIEGNPEIYYAMSNEIREKIIGMNPSLEPQLIQIDVNNYEFTEDVKAELALLGKNHGIDFPDEIFELIPYVTEIVLGIRVIVDIAKVQRDFNNIKLTDKRRIAGVKVLILFSKFGVNAILGLVGTKIGTIILPGAGTAVGGVSGVVIGSLINKQIAPYTLEIAYKLLNLEVEDVFYYKNSERIHDLAINYRKNRNILEDLNFNN